MARNTIYTEKWQGWPLLFCHHIPPLSQCKWTQRGCSDWANTKAKKLSKLKPKNMKERFAFAFTQCEWAQVGDHKKEVLLYLRVGCSLWCGSRCACRPRVAVYFSTWVSTRLPQDVCHSEVASCSYCPTPIRARRNLRERENIFSNKNQ